MIPVIFQTFIIRMSKKIIKMKVMCDRRFKGIFGKSKRELYDEWVAYIENYKD